MGETSLVLKVLAEYKGQDIQKADKDVVKLSGSASKLSQVAANTSKGVTALEDDLKGMGGSADKSALQLAVVKQQSQLLNTEMNKLARSVATGEKSFDDAERELEEFRSKLVGVGAESGKTEQQLDNLEEGIKDVGETSDTSGSRMQRLGETVQKGIGIIKNISAGALAMGAVFKKAFDFAEEGAQLQLLEDRLGRLAESIGSNSDRIIAALGKATGGMLTTAQQMDSASQIISLGLADNEEDVVKLATLVSELGWDMQTVILTFANNSKVRLDSLGLSMSDVEERTRKFIAAGHDVDKAFDLAVLEAGQAKLELLGSAANSNVGAYQRFRVKVAELTDELKVALAEGLTPVVQILANDYGEAAAETIQANIDTAESMEELIANGQRLVDQYKGWGTLGQLVTGTSDEIADGMINTARAIARGSDSLEDYEKNIAAAFGGHNSMLLDHLRVLGLTVEELYEAEKAAYRYERGMAQAESADRKFFIAAEAAAEATETHRASVYDLLGVTTQFTIAELDAADAMTEFVESIDDRTFERLVTIFGDEAAALDYLKLAMEDGGQATDAYEVSVEDLGETAETTTGDLAELARIVQQSTEAQLTAAGQLFDAYDDLAAAQGEYVTVYKDNSSEITEIQTQLTADLTDEQKAGLQEQLDLLNEFSPEAIAIWNQLQGDLTESQRRSLIAQLADMQGTHGEMRSVWTGDAAAAEDAQERIDAALGLIKRNYQQLLLDIAAVRLGEVFGEDAVEVQLALVEIQRQMGLIGDDEANFLKTLIQNTANAEGALGTMFDDFLADKELTEQEIGILIGVMGGIDNQAVTSQSALETMARVGVEEFNRLQGQIGEIPPQIEAIKDRSQEYVDEGPYEAIFRVINEAEPTIEEIKQGLAGIPDETVTVTVQYEQGPPPPGVGNLPPPDENVPVPGASTGGLVTGGIANRDSVLMRLMPGEFIVQQSAVRELGVDALYALNSGAPSGALAMSPGMGRLAGGQTAAPQVSFQSNDKLLFIVNDKGSAALAASLASQQRRKAVMDVLGY